MRYLLITLLGFFGPALLMFLLRLFWYQLRHQWLTKRNQPEIIDITPTHNKRPSKMFITTWLIVSVCCTALLLWQIDDSPANKQTYVPAHVDAQGNFVPAITTQEHPTQEAIAKEGKE